MRKSYEYKRETPAESRAILRSQGLWPFSDWITCKKCGRRHHIDDHTIMSGVCIDGCGSTERRR